MAPEAKVDMNQLLKQKKDCAKSGDLYALLGVDEAASTEEIKNAYFKLARTFHPDTLKKHGGEGMRRDGAGVFKALTDAYQTLLTPAKRYAYLRERKASQPMDPEEEQKILDQQAKIAVHQGRMFLNRRHWTKAEEYFRQYAEIRPDDARGWVYLGWSLFQNTDKALEERLQEAKTCFVKAINSDEKNADAHYYLSLYHKERKEYDLQERKLRKALKQKKDHVPAQREMRLLEMRAGQRNKPESILSFLKNLFGGKKESDSKSGKKGKK